MASISFCSTVFAWSFSVRRPELVLSIAGGWLVLVGEFGMPKLSSSGEWIDSVKDGAREEEVLSCSDKSGAS